MHIKRLLLNAVIAAAFCSPSLIQAAEKASVEPASLKQTISTALAASAAAWTRGDLDAFMSLYENSPKIRYINPSGMTEGYAGIRKMYASRFGKGEPMGDLSITLIDVQQVGEDYAFATGRFTLKQASGKVVTGLTTLLFHRSAKQWHIVSDHTS